MNQARVISVAVMKSSSATTRDISFLLCSAKGKTSVDYL